MPTLTLDPAALQSYVPHRGANLIPDLVTLSADRTIATSTTHVPAGDERGRELFGRRGADGTVWWYEPFIAELLALTGVPLMHEQLAPNGQVAVFSMLARVAMAHPAPLHRPITGHAQIQRVRSGFFTFSTWAECDGKRLLEAEVIAGSAVMGEIAAFPARPFHGQLPCEALPADALGWKPAHLRFADQVMHAEPGERRLAVAYTYPTDHPFVPTHFPGAALMMGVTQWGAIADAAWIAARRFGIEGAVVASGAIKRQDGSDIVDVRDLVLDPSGGAPRIVATKRIAFREPVRPGDGLIIEVTVAPRA